MEDRDEATIDRLLGLQHEINEEGRPRPASVYLQETARRRFIEWHDLHRRRQAELEGVLSGHWAKLVAYCARLALLVHLVRQADGESVGERIDQDSVEAAIAIIEWHKREARRVYAMLRESDEEHRAHKPDLLAALGPAMPADGPIREDATGGFTENDTDRAPSGWEDSIDPPEPCGKCGGLVFRWSIPGDRRCVACDPPVAAVWLLERAEAIRRRRGIPIPAGAAERLAETKRLADT